MRADLLAFELDTRILLPRSVKESLTRQVESSGTINDWSLEGLLSFRSVDVFHPLRAMPLYLEPDRSFVGLYYPPEVQSPLVVQFDSVYRVLWGVTDDLDAFGNRPGDWMPGEDSLARIDVSREASWSRFVPGYGDFSAGEHLLKPMWWAMEPLRAETDALLDRIFAKVDSRSGPSSVAEASIAGKPQFFDSAKWIEAAEELQRQGFHRDALGLLDNLRAVMCNMQTAYAPPVPLKRAESEARMILLKELDVAAALGDHFDMRLIRAMLRQQ